MPLLNVECLYDHEALEVSLEFAGEPPMFNLSTSPGFVEHMNSKHGGRMNAVETWPPRRLSEVRRRIRA